MGSPAEVIDGYQALLALTRQLREAAERGEWDQLTGIQQERTGVGTRLAAGDAVAVLDEDARQRKGELIDQVLAEEAVVRDLVQACLTQMQTAIRDGRQELRVLREYRSQDK